MKILKYIINKNKIPVIFSAKMTHNEVLQEGLSAGFLILYFKKNDKLFSAKCYGESCSLNLKKSLEDEELIEYFLNNQFLTI
jgi:hypothetical protein